MSKVIAIDGPAASGKSTVAGALARKLGIAYISTGSVYRAVALACERAKRSFDAVPEEFLAGLKLDYRPGADGVYQLMLNGVFPGAELRRPEIAGLTIIYPFFYLVP